ncbi:hypothetical protein PybrP1_005268 [[Pythium] brassicae (nom. inval.)]|nr:hypothetical protein PybrP1_005268 [[Pythium] brassicae (nom. inval.)]
MLVNLVKCSSIPIPRVAQDHQGKSRLEELVQGHSRVHQVAHLWTGMDPKTEFLLGARHDGIGFPYIGSAVDDDPFIMR